MGKIVTPKYRVEYRDNDFKSVLEAIYTGHPGHACKTQCWEGRATYDRLKSWRAGTNKSYERGGSNAHVSEYLGFIVRIGNCQIVEQKTKRIVCEFTAPMFEVA